MRAQVRSCPVLQASFVARLPSRGSPAASLTSPYASMDRAHGAAPFVFLVLHLWASGSLVAGRAGKSSKLRLAAQTPQAVRHLPHLATSLGFAGPLLPWTRRTRQWSWAAARRHCGSRPVHGPWLHPMRRSAAATFHESWAGRLTAPHRACKKASRPAAAVLLSASRDRQLDPSSSRHGCEAELPSCSDLILPSFVCIVYHVHSDFLERDQTRGGNVQLRLRLVHNHGGRRREILSTAARRESR